MAGLLKNAAREKDNIDWSKKLKGFHSKAQQRLFFAKEDRGELPKGKALEWAHDTPNIKKLPEYARGGKKMKKTSSEIAESVLGKTAKSLASKTWGKGKPEPAAKAPPGEGSRFEALKSKLSKQGAAVRDPAALAAAIGRKKFGKKKFQEMAAAGRKKSAQEFSMKKTAAQIAQEVLYKLAYGAMPNLATPPPNIQGRQTIPVGPRLRRAAQQGPGAAPPAPALGGRGRPISPRGPGS